MSDDTVPINRQIRCAACGKEPTRLSEQWSDHCIEFILADGKRSREGYLQDGHPTKVVAVCECGHYWTLRGVLQITSLDVAEVPNV